MGYVIGVDLGTTFSAAALGSGDRVEIFQLGTRMAAVPSVVYLREDGTVAVGEAAERRALTDPSRVAREFKRRLGDPAPIVLGRTPFDAESLTAHLLQWVVGRVVAEKGGPPDAVVMTHPASFGPYKMEILEEAVRLADVGEVRFVSEPEAAAIHYSAGERLDPGDLLAVYDLGGGTLDVAMLRVVPDGFEIVGVPEGMNRFGGIDLDEAVLAHVRDTLGDAFEALALRDPAVMTALAALRAACREAKETLSSDTDAVVPVMLPDLHTQVRITRGEFEAMIRPRIDETIAVLERVVASAGPMDEVARLLLVGGASRIPLIGETIRRVTGRPVALDANPKHAVALGAARLALEQVVEAEEASAVPIPAEEPRPVEPEEPPEVGGADEARGEAAAEAAADVEEPEAEGVKAAPAEPEAMSESAEEPPEHAVSPEGGDAVYDAQPHQSEEAAPARPGMRIPGRWLAGIGLLAAIAAVVGIALVLGGGSGGDDAAGASTVTTATTTSGATTTSPSTTTSGTAAPMVNDLEGAALWIVGNAPGSQNAVSTAIEQDFNGPYNAAATYLEDSAQPSNVLAEGDPDLLVVGDVRQVTELAAGGSLVSLEALGIDVSALESAYGETLVGLVEMDGLHYGIPALADTKSLIWYHRATFEQRGYGIPGTWEELIALSDRMVSDGLTPWCLGAGSGEASGWPLTDWVEDIVIRTAGSAVYDGWTRHEIPFDDDTIASALDRAGEIFFGDGYVFLGAAQAADVEWLDAAGMLLEPGPPCVMNRQASFLRSLLPAGSVSDLGVFGFPTIDGGPGAIVAPRFLVAITARPGVAEFVRAWSSEAFQCSLGLAGIEYASPRVEIDPGCYQDDMAVTSAGVVREASAAGRLRIDASDQMPEPVQSAFYTALLHFLGEGPAPARAYLADVEGAWGG